MSQIVFGRARRDSAQYVDLSRWTHLSRFSLASHHGVASTVRVEVSTEDVNPIRAILRDADWALEAGGALELRLPTDDRGRHAVLLAFHGILGSRYDHDIRGDQLIARKRIVAPGHAIDNRHWTIAIISGGGNEARVVRILDSIEAEQIPDVDVLIVGPLPALPLPAWCRHIAYRDHPTDPRFAIGAKKNVAAAVAQHENVLLLHDRFRLRAGWYQAMQQLRTGWDALAMPAHKEGAPAARLDDWVEYAAGMGEERHERRLNSYWRTYPFDLHHRYHRRLPYGVYSDRVTLNGGAFAVKREWLRRIPLHPCLHWGETEDSFWAECLQNAGAVISLAHGCALENLPVDRHASRPKGPLVLPAALSRFAGDARMAARRIVFRSLRAAVRRLNVPVDLFAQRAVFAKDFLAVHAAELVERGESAWPSTSRVLIRGSLSRRDNLRELLAQVSRCCKAHTEVWIDWPTTGISFFRRAVGERSAEALFLEIGVTLNSDFEVRAIFCTEEHNFLVQLVRVRAARPLSISRLGICGDGDRAALESLASRLSPKWQWGLGADCDAVLYAAAGTSLQVNRPWQDHYATSGLVIQAPSSRARVLDGAVLCTKSLWDLMATGDGDGALDEQQRQHAENALVLAGVWPSRVDHARAPLS